MTTATKAKRLLKNFDFEGNGACVSLVGPKLGSGANSRKILAIKSTNTGIQPNDPVKVQKALEQITVTLSMEEFLRKFFGLWYEDAELLTKLLGFETEFEADLKIDENNNDWEKWHQNMLAEKLSKFTLMKSLHDNPNQTISDEDFISITILQSQIEKSLQQQTEEDPLKIQVEKARYEQLESVEKAHEAVVAEAAQLKVEKSAMEAELADLRTQVQKAKEEKEATEFNAFQESLKDLVAEAELATVAKSLFTLKATSPESAEVVIKSLKDKKELLEKSDLFKEESSGEVNLTPEEIKKAALKAAINEPYTK